MLTRNFPADQTQATYTNQGLVAAVQFHQALVSKPAMHGPFAITLTLRLWLLQTHRPNERMMGSRSTNDARKNWNETEPTGSEEKIPAAVARIWVQVDRDLPKVRAWVGTDRLNQQLSSELPAAVRELPFCDGTGKYFSRSRSRGPSLFVTVRLARESWKITLFVARSRHNIPSTPFTQNIPNRK